MTATAASALALASVAHLGRGAAGPWANRADLVLEARAAGRINFQPPEELIIARFGGGS